MCVNMDVKKTIKVSFIVHNNVHRIVFNDTPKVLKSCPASMKSAQNRAN